MEVELIHLKLKDQHQLLERSLQEVEQKTSQKHLGTYLIHNRYGKRKSYTR